MSIPTNPDRQCQFAIDVDMRDHSCTPGHCVYRDYPEQFEGAQAKPAEAPPDCPQCGGADVLLEPRTQITCRRCKDVFLSEAALYVSPQPAEVPALTAQHAINALRQALFNCDIQGALHMAIVDDFRAALAPQLTPEPK